MMATGTRGICRCRQRVKVTALETNLDECSWERRDGCMLPRTVSDPQHGVGGRDQTRGLRNAGTGRTDQSFGFPNAGRGGQRGLHESMRQGGPIEVFDLNRDKNRHHRKCGGYHYPPRDRITWRERSHDGHHLMGCDRPPLRIRTEASGRPSRIATSLYDSGAPRVSEMRATRKSGATSWIRSGAPHITPGNALPRCAVSISGENGTAQGWAARSSVLCAVGRLRRSLLAPWNCCPRIRLCCLVQPPDNL